MNFILAVGITMYLLTQGIMEPTGSVRVERVLSGSPAALVGLEPGDVIRFASPYPGKKITLEMEPELHKPSQLIEFTKNHLGEQVSLQVLRNGQLVSFVVVPRKEYPKGEGPMGVVITDLALHRYGVAEAPGLAVRINLSRAKDMFVSIGTTLWRLVTLKPLAEDVAGPIGIAQVTGQAVKFGFLAVLEFMSILSLNLAVLNILPIPALDGGRLAFVFAEKLLGRRLRPAFERSTHQVGMIILFALMLLVSINDIARLARGGS